MTFRNEYTPPLAQPIESVVLAKAREFFSLGHSWHSSWTVDYQRESALVHRGSTRNPEGSNEDFWAYMDSKGHYSFTTEELSRSASVSETTQNSSTVTRRDYWEFARNERHALRNAEVIVTYKLRGFYAANGWSVPDLESLSFIKEALRERERRFIFDLEAFAGCQLTLIDSRTGNEI